jgi:asparagine synthase (glutamine-hydrolysing)
MPGIAGFISPNAQAKGDALERMVGTMLHERSYSSGSFISSELNVGVGWVSHPKSFVDPAAFWNVNRDICVVFSGEEFSQGSIRNRELKPGTARHSAEYLVELYEKKGPEFFATLNGIFAGLVIDFRRGRAFLFNDRYGLGRIYWCERSDGFFFASEAKALLALFPDLRQLQNESFGETFSLGCVLQNRSLFKGVFLLPPASVWSFQKGNLERKDTYFAKDTWENQPVLEPEDYYEKLKATFIRILPAYLESSQPIAMSLTGGLDSRIIMAWSRSAAGRLPCYSHRGVIRECADSRIARRVAAICDQTHQTLTVGGDFFSLFPELAKKAVYVTDGAMDASGAAGLYVNGLARDHIAPVRMTGNYGSEILRRLIAFKPRPLNNALFSPSFLPQVTAAPQRYKAENEGNRLSFVAFKQVPWHHYSRFALEQSQLTIRSPYLDNELVAIAYQAPAGLVTNQHLGARLIRDGNPALAAFPTDRGPLGRPGQLGWISEQFHEFTFKAEYAYDYGMPQWLAKIDRTFQGLHLERLFLGRHKYLHYRYWYRHPLADYVRDTLLCPSALGRSYLNRAYVEKIVNAHIKGIGNYTSEIHMLLTAELIHTQLLVPR